MTIAGIEKVTSPGGGTIAFRFTDATFPARQHIEKAVNDAGYDLDDSYSGTSDDHLIIELFLEIIKLGRFSVLETLIVPVSKTSMNQTLDAVKLRFEVTPKEDIFINGIKKILENAPQPTLSFTNINHIHYVVLCSIILCASKKTLTAVTFNEIQRSWQELYNNTNVAPLALIHNVADTLGALYKDREFDKSPFAANSDYSDIIYLACKFSDTQILEFKAANVTAEQIRTYMGHGFTTYQELLDFAVAMPAEWFEAIK